MTSKEYINILTVMLCEIYVHFKNSLYNFFKPAYKLPLLNKKILPNKLHWKFTFCSHVFKNIFLPVNSDDEVVVQDMK